MSVLFALINVFCTFYLAQDQISKTESGKRFIEVLRTGTVTFFQWRANSEIREDLKRLSKFFGLITIVGIVLFLLIHNVGIQIYPIFVIVLLFSALLWISLSWGTNTKKEILDWIRTSMWIVLSPWIAFLCDSTKLVDNMLILPQFGEILSVWGVNVSGSMQIAFALFVLLVIVYSLMTVFWLLMNTIIVGLFISILWISVRLSRIVIYTKTDLKINIVWILFFLSLIATSLK